MTRHDEINELHSDADSVEDDPQTYLTYKSKAVKTGYGIINNLGLPLPAAPSVEAKDWQLPQSLNDIRDEDLSRHLAIWTNLWAYADFHEAEIRSNVEALKASVKDRMYAGLLAVPKAKDVTLTDRKAEAAMSPQIRKLEVRLVHMEAAHRMIAALKNGYEQKYKAISREIARREQCDWGTN